MYHVSQVDTAFDDFFCRLKLISRFGSQLWLVDIKIKNPRAGKYFIVQIVITAITRLLKTFLCRYVYPICKWKSPLLSLFLLSGKIELLKITVVCSAPILFWLQIEDYFLFTADFLSLQILQLGDCFPFPSPLENRFFDVLSLKQTGWKCLQHDTRRLGGVVSSQFILFVVDEPGGERGGGGRAVSQVSVPFVFVDC